MYIFLPIFFTFVLIKSHDDRFFIHDVTADSKASMQNNITLLQPHYSYCCAVARCRNFVHACSAALDLNASLVSADQAEYHESLRRNFYEMAERLAAMFGEPVHALSIAHLLHFLMLLCVLFKGFPKT